MAGSSLRHKGVFDSACPDELVRFCSQYEIFHSRIASQKDPVFEGAAVISKLDRYNARIFERRFPAETPEADPGRFARERETSEQLRFAVNRD